MHKLLAIFLAIGIVNASVLPDTCNRLCNQPTAKNLEAFLNANGYKIAQSIRVPEGTTSVTIEYNITQTVQNPPGTVVVDVNILNILVKIQSITTNISIVEVNTLLQQLSLKYNGVVPLDILLVKLGFLFGFDLSEFLPSQWKHSSFNVDVQLYLNVLGSISGFCSLQTLVYKLVYVVEGFYESIQIYPDVPKPLEPTNTTLTPTPSTATSPATLPTTTPTAQSTTTPTAQSTASPATLPTTTATAQSTTTLAPHTTATSPATLPTTTATAQSTTTLAPQSTRTPAPQPTTLSTTTVKQSTEVPPPTIIIDIWEILIKIQEFTGTASINDIEDILKLLLVEYGSSCSLEIILVRLGKLFPGFDTIDFFPSYLLNIEVNINAVLNKITSIQGECSFQTFFVTIVNSNKVLGDVVASTPGTVLNIIVSLLRTKKQIDADIVVAALNVLLEKDVNTLGPILVEIAKCFKIGLLLSNIPSSIVNINVDLPSVIEILSGKPGLINIGVVINALVNERIVSSVTTVPGTLLSIVSNLLVTNKKVHVVNLLNVLQYCVENDINTLGPVLVQIGKLYGLSIKLKDIPSSITDMFVDVSVISRLLVGTTGLVGINFVLALFATVVDGLLNLVITVPGTLLSIISMLLIKGKECSIVDLVATLKVLAAKRIRTLGPVLIEIGKLIKVKLEKSDIPQGIYNIPVNVSVLIGALAGKTGLIGVNAILHLLAVCVNSLLNLVVSIESGLKALLNLFGNIGGLISVSALTAALSALGAAASLKDIILCILNVAGVPLIGLFIPKAFELTTISIEPLLTALSGFSGSISITILVSLIGVLCPGFLSVSITQIVLGFVGNIFDHGCLLCKAVDDLTFFIPSIVNNYLDWFN